MGLEIERKFSVNIEQVNLKDGIAIKQAYIETSNNTVVRVRVKGEKGFLTIKGENCGATRLEFEYEIPLDEANEMIEKLCKKPYIDKTRYEIQHENHLWEVDVFYKDNEGLVIAEVELESEEEEFVLPSWIGKELTGDARYYNNQLMKNPYKNWK